MFLIFVYIIMISLLTHCLAVLTKIRDEVSRVYTYTVLICNYMPSVG